MRCRFPGQRPPILVLAMLLASPTLPAAQGRTDYFNVESPQVKPMTVARVSGHDYLLVCNTPDNSVEVWDTNETLSVAQRFKLRVRVGLEPVSVAFNEENQRVYTADFLSDSVSMFSLLVENGALTFRPLATTYVGDEPVGLAFSEDWDQLFVTHTTPCTFGWRDALTLDPVGAVTPLTNMGAVDLVDDDAAPTKALKEPRAVLARNNKLFVLAFKGGNAAAGTPSFFPYDWDLYVRDLALPGPQAVTTFGTLGTTNFNMAFASNDDLWVVGGEAQNVTTNNVNEVRSQPTGFVKSMIYRVTGLFSPGGPTRIPLDLNDSSSGPVSASSALVQPTDVIVYEPPGSGIYKVYFTAFNSDRLGVLSPSSNPNPFTWPLTRIEVPEAVSVPPDQGMAGPRGLARKYANPSDGSADPGARIYVMNRIDNSFSIVDPGTDTLIATIPVHHDPTPLYVKSGRRFLYSTLHSNGFVSCASCHMDGRTDSLLWKLGAPAPAPIPPFPLGFADGLPQLLAFFQDKGAMMTQTLQGLLNFEVEPDAQDFFTNARYHWRGDKADLLGFNEAFINLMGDPNPAQPPDVGGLTTVDMKAFRDFVNSIHYPPNPVELLTRKYSGDEFSATFEGTGAQRGLKLFHTKSLEQICKGRSCVQCHALPEGSNNRFTVETALDRIESAQLRGLTQREANLERIADVNPTLIVNANSGLAHLGASKSLNAFLRRFEPDFTTAGGVFETGKLIDVNQFTREFDVGTSPMAGRTLTVKTTNAAAIDTFRTLNLFENQAQVANVGLAVHARISGVDTGYWLDLTQTVGTTLLYRVEGGATLKTRADLIAMLVLARDRLVFVCTPLGSERRVASVSGTATTLSGSTPASLELRPCPTNTANVRIPTLLDNWDPFPVAPGIAAFVFNNGSTSIETPHFLKTVRLLQRGLQVDANGAYGINQIRHDAPRRLAVAGFGILPGATLMLSSPNSQTQPNLSLPPNPAQVIEFVLPLHPTSEVLEDGRRVWQTAAEFEPLKIYMLMLGGQFAPGVRNVNDPTKVDAIAESPSTYVPRYDPTNFNWHFVRVKNPSSAVPTDGGWQRLTLALPPP